MDDKNNKPLEPIEKIEKEKYVIKTLRFLCIYISTVIVVVIIAGTISISFGKNLGNYI